MTIYLDRDFVCHLEDDGSRRAVETSVFDGKCREFIEGFRFIPVGESRTLENGQVFTGQMTCPVKPYAMLLEAQEAYLESTLREVGITIAPKPVHLPTKPGYEWRAVQTAAGGSITWDLTTEYNPNLPGTRENPIAFEDGMALRQNYFYAKGGGVKLWFGGQEATSDWEASAWLSPEDCP